MNLLSTPLLTPCEHPPLPLERHQVGRPGELRAREKQEGRDLGPARPEGGRPARKVSVRTPKKIITIISPSPSLSESADDATPRTLVDILFCNKDEAEAFVGERDLEVLSRLASVVVVSLGAEGCMAMHGGKTYRAPAPEIKVVDTTGAGDFFTAGERWNDSTDCARRVFFFFSTRFFY